MNYCKKSVNLKFQECEKNNSDKYCKKIFNINGGLQANKQWTSGFDALAWFQKQLGDARPIVEKAQNAAFKHINRAICMYATRNRQGGVGVGGYFAIGDGRTGVAYTTQGIVGILTDKNITTIGVFEVKGFALTFPGISGYTSTPSPSELQPSITGAYAGYGAFGWYTNATFDNFIGAFDAINANAGNGVFSVGGSYSFNGSNLEIAVAPGLPGNGYGFGLDISQYPTNTVPIAVIKVDVCAQS
jgi:hypothetical protein